MADPGALYITRQIEFSAAHRLYREDWTETKNFEAFGECANPYGHGHNYLLEVTLRGFSDPQTGMVTHFSGLKKMLQEVVLVPLDHRHLNYDVPFLKDVLPTSENLVCILWEILRDNVARVATEKGNRYTLHRLKLSSSSRNWVEYFGP